MSSSSIDFISSNCIQDFFEPVITFCQNSKVQRIALIIFKTIGFSACGAGLGALSVAVLGCDIALLAGLSMSSMFLLGAGIGAGIGLFIYFATASVYTVIETYGFPTHRYRICPPLQSEKWHSDTNRVKFRKVFQDIISLDVYQTWKLHHGNLSDQKAEEKLWKLCVGGTCQGQAQSLLILLKDHLSLEGTVLLSKVKPKMVFYRQMLEYMRADLSEDPAASSLAFTIPDADPFYQKSFSKQELASDARLFRNTFTDPMHSEDPHESIAMTIRLQNDKGSHTIFAQIHPVFRIYDPYNNVYNGLHEGFKSKQHFLKYLQKHIKGYQSSTRPCALRYNDVIIRAYRIDCPAARQLAMAADAGANPLA